MPNTETAFLYVAVDYDPAVTNEESLASALDNLIQTALSTPDVLDAYGNPAVGEFQALTKQATKPVTVVTVTDPDSGGEVEVEIRKAVEGGYLVGIDGSYLDQDVGPVYDPCNFGCVLIVPDDEE